MLGELPFGGPPAPHDQAPAAPERPAASSSAFVVAQDLSRIHRVAANGCDQVCALASKEVRFCSLNSCSESSGEDEMMMDVVPSFNGGSSASRRPSRGGGGPPIVDLERTFSLPHSFEIAAWSPCGRFLFCGDAMGRLHALHVGAQKIFLTQTVPHTDGQGFKEIHVVRQRCGQLLTVLILLRSNRLVCLQNVDLSEVNIALEGVGGGGGGPAGVGGPTTVGTKCHVSSSAGNNKTSSGASRQGSPSYVSW